MSNILVRDLSDPIARFLKVSAHKNRHSINGEILAILEKTATMNDSRMEAIERTTAIRKGFQPQKTSAAKIIRQLRDAPSVRTSV